MWLGLEKEGLTSKGHKETSGDDRNVLYLSFGGSFPDVYISQNSLNCILYKNIICM